MALQRRGAVVIDVRPVPDYVAAHVPSSVAIQLRPVFATWLGWTVPRADIPLVIVRNPDQDLDEVLWQARKVGYDSVIGELAGGLDSWTTAGLPVASHELADPTCMEPERTIDVRQHSEFAAERIPGAVNVELGALVVSSLPEGPLVVMCGHGERAATAASLLEREGRTEVSVLEGGPADWVKAHEKSSTVGP